MNDSLSALFLESYVDAARHATHEKYLIQAAIGTFSDEPVPSHARTLKRSARYSSLIEDCYIDLLS